MYDLVFEELFRKFKNNEEFGNFKDVFYLNREQIECKDDDDKELELRVKLIVTQMYLVHNHGLINFNDDFYFNFKSENSNFDFKGIVKDLLRIYQHKNINEAEYNYFFYHPKKRLETLNFSLEEKRNQLVQFDNFFPYEELVGTIEIIKKFDAIEENEKKLQDIDRIKREIKMCELIKVIQDEYIFI